jgi:tRNA-binding protein
MRPSENKSETVQTIAYSDFEKVLFVVGTITRVEAFPEARWPAYKVWADFGLLSQCAASPTPAML